MVFIPKAHHSRITLGNGSQHFHTVLEGRVKQQNYQRKKKNVALTIP